MKKIFKKIVTVVIAGAMLLSVSACSRNPFQGKSAYEIAVENGFTGTEQEWLNSLYGKNGEDGEDLDIEDIYEKSGYTGTFQEFLKEYFGKDSLDIVEDNNTQQIAKNLMSVVSISAFSAGSAGSGVIIDLNKEAGTAYIVTNYHVVYDVEVDESDWKKNIYVYLYGARPYETELQANGSYKLTGYGDGMLATYVGGSINYDIALLKIEGNEYLKNSAAQEATIGNSDTAVVGEKVYAIGNPQGHGIAVTEGALSVVSEYITLTMNVLYKVNNSFGGYKNVIAEKEFTYRVMRTDAAINSGNSGGALFNVKGELIGIVNAKSATTIVNGEINSIDSMAYALPITNVKYVVDNLLDNSGKVMRAMFGVTLTAVGSRAEFDKNGNITTVQTIGVDTVNEDSIAEGLLEKGDVLKTIQINDGEVKNVTRQYTVIDYMLNVRQGDTVKMKISRGDVEREISFTFDKTEYFTDYSPSYFVANASN